MAEWRHDHRHQADLPLTDLASCCNPTADAVMDAAAAERLANVLKALAEPTRLRLISLITARSSNGEACVCDLTEPVGLSQPTVSHHLKVLVDAGLITREQRGKWAYYTLVPDALDRRRRGDQPSPGKPPMTRIVPLQPQHWDQVRQIYADGIATGHATFESEPPSWEHFNRTKLPDHRLVAIDDGTVVGWIAASPVSDRCVYAGVVEHSVYVAPAAQGRGIGRQLLEAFAASTEDAGIWTIQSGVFAENTASLTLHHAAGYRDIGTRERIGLMTYGPHAGQWRDVILIERRSPTIGH